MVSYKRLAYLGNAKLTTERKKLERKSLDCAFNAPTRSLTKRLCRRDVVKRALCDAIKRGLARRRDDLWNIFGDGAGRPPAASRRPSAFQRAKIWVFGALAAPAVLFTAWKCSRKLAKCGLALSLSAARAIASFFATGSSRLSAMRIAKYWCLANIMIFMVHDHLKTRGFAPRTMKRTCDLCRRFVERGILAEGQAENTFRLLIEISGRRLDDCRWPWFNKLHGGIFNPQTREILTAFMMFGPDCSEVLFGTIRDLAHWLDGRFVDAVRSIWSDFISASGLETMSAMLGRSVIRLLAVYTAKMRMEAEKYMDRELIEKWTLARQTLVHLRQTPPGRDTDRQIEELVREFSDRANAAGAAALAWRAVSEEDRNFEVSVKKAAAMLGVTPKTIYRWENGETPCPVPNYSRKLRLKEAAFRSWAPNYTFWRDLNEKSRASRSS